MGGREIVMLTIYNTHTRMLFQVYQVQSSDPNLLSGIRALWGLSPSSHGLKNEYLAWNRVSHACLYWSGGPCIGATKSSTKMYMHCKMLALCWSRWKSCANPLCWHSIWNLTPNPPLFQVGIIHVCIHFSGFTEVWGVVLPMIYLWLFVIPYERLYPLRVQY